MKPKLHDLYSCRVCGWPHPIGSICPNEGVKENSIKPYYQDSAVTIYHGDCWEIFPSLDKFDLLLTDPPYGIDFASQPTTGQRRAGMKPIEWDKVPVEDSLLLEARNICDKQIIWGGNYFTLPPTRCLLSWFKADAPPSMGNVEFAWTNLNQNSRQIAQSISATNPERVGHPTQKPLAVMTFSIVQAGDNVDTILDPFAGSGTTGRAAKDLGKKATLIEREERCCEIAAKRMAQEVLGL